jgi:hypothetical protein
MRNGRLIKFAAALAGAALVVFAGQSAQAGIGTERPAGRAEGQNACSNSTHAMRQLAMIDHTSDGGFQCLGVSVEGDTVQAIRLERHSFSPDTGIEQIKVVEYPATTVDSRRGAVIDGVPGTGKLEISYLFNGITGEFRTCQMVLGRTANAGWRLVNRLEQPVSLIGVRIREVPVIGVVGIANLEGACS